PSSRSPSSTIGFARCSGKASGIAGRIGMPTRWPSGSGSMGPDVNAGGAALVAVDGVNGAAVKAAARARLAAADRHLRGGISVWDASGVFGELAVAGDEAGRPSARTLLLLYAADLAFRLRWEIRPALAEGRLVVAAPYVDTAIAF